MGLMPTTPSAISMEAACSRDLLQNDDETPTRPPQTVLRISQRKAPATPTISPSTSFRTGSSCTRSTTTSDGRSRSARKKRALLELGEEDGIQPRDFNTGQVPESLRGFEDEILDVGSRGRVIVPPEARLKMRRLLPTKAINQTDFDPVRKWPIFLSIETQRPSKSEEEAELQVGIWLTAQWKLLQKLTSICRELRRGQPHQQQQQKQLAQSVEETDSLGLAPLPGLGFLPAIVIVGHEWKFSALTVEGNKAFL
ncbi:hypothetical protein MCOR05_010344 [Pyricularia oryzae]|nr:hypothetical protein MCOR05_010344 [Pyricularia oryzae]